MSEFRQDKNEKFIKLTKISEKRLTKISSRNFHLPFSLKFHSQFLEFFFVIFPFLSPRNSDLPGMSTLMGQGYTPLFDIFDISQDKPRSRLF